MSLYMETTKIPPERTAQEICALLVEAGAQQVVTEYDRDRQISALRWTMRVNGAYRPFSMPIRIEPVFATLQKQRSPRFRERGAREDREKSGRVAWRQLLRWVQAQLAFIETGMVDPGEAFLPYVQVAIGTTLYEAIASGKLKALPAPVE